jgi:hypothetical protein
MGQPHGPRVELHRAGQAPAVWLRRELLRHTAGRVLEGRCLRQSYLGPDVDRAQAVRLQPRQATLSAQRAHAGSAADEPRSQPAT